MRTENEGTGRQQAATQPNRVNESAAINQRNEANREQQNQQNRVNERAATNQRNEATRNEQARASSRRA